MDQIHALSSGHLVVDSLWDVTSQESNPALDPEALGSRPKLRRGGQIRIQERFQSQKNEAAFETRWTRGVVPLMKTFSEELAYARI